MLSTVLFHIVSIISGLEKGWKPKIEPTANEEEIEVDAVDAVGAVDAVASIGKARKEGTTTVSNDLQELDHQNRLKGDIVFKNVFFKYKGMQSNMLKDINFTIKEGSLLNYSVVSFVTTATVTAVTAVTAATASLAVSKKILIPCPLYLCFFSGPQRRFVCRHLRGERGGQKHAVQIVDAAVRSYGG